MELEDKYVVLKWTDITPALTVEQKIQLSHICDAIARFRLSHGKLLNQYIVINQDEPYFLSVLKLMDEAERETRQQEGLRDDPTRDTTERS